MGDKKDQGYGVLGSTAYKPVERHGLDAISHFLYDSDQGAFMGRTPLSWAKIFVFYCIYYSCLALFWTGCLMIFMQTTINDESPRWQMGESIIGRSPALGVRPSPMDAKIDSSMILYKYDEEKDKNGIEGWLSWQNRTKIFLDQHQAPLNKYKYCQELNITEEDDKNCIWAFRREQLGVCGKGNFGYEEGKPCVIIKLNRIFGLEHEYYGAKPKDYPDDFPAELAKHIAEQENKEQVWVNCQGENPADNDMMGDISYFPKERGFPSKYFPYLNQVGYQSPLMAIKFENPTKGMLLHIECRAWAKNIGYDRRDKLGKAHFELMIYDDATNPKLVK